MVLQKENPDVTAAPGARAFEHGGDLPLGAGVKKRPHIVLPCRLVEIGGEQPARFVGEQWIDAGHEFARQMVMNDLIG